MEQTVETLTTTEAAIVAGVSVDGVNRAIEKSCLRISIGPRPFARSKWMLVSGSRFGLRPPNGSLLTHANA
jgi:hypothetical protein